MTKSPSRRSRRNDSPFLKEQEIWIVKNLGQLSITALRRRYIVHFQIANKSPRQLPPSKPPWKKLQPLSTAKSFARWWRIFGKEQKTAYRWREGTSSLPFSDSNQLWYHTKRQSICNLMPPYTAIYDDYNRSYKGLKKCICFWWRGSSSQAIVLPWFTYYMNISFHYITFIVGLPRTLYVMRMSQFFTVI